MNSKKINIKKGLFINLKGRSAFVISEAPESVFFALKPDDFIGITPKLCVKVGNEVKIGDALFVSKSNPKIVFSAPASGSIEKIERGAKRKILSIIIKSDKKENYKDFGKEHLENLSKETIIEKLLESGCWAFIKQRPYDIIAHPEDTPRDIFISCFETAPLSPNYNFVMNSQENEKSFQTGIDVLAKIVGKKVNLCINEESSFFEKENKNATIHRVFGKHPAGNVGVQINHIQPINAGEKIWTLHPQDVCIIGNLFITGNFKPERIIALAGSAVKKPQYYKVKIGQSVNNLLKEKINENSRVISGNVFTGQKICKENGFLGFYDNIICAIPNGNRYRPFGWVPFVGSCKIHSASKTSFSWLFKKAYALNTNMNGEERAMVVTGEMEKVFPMDIYPMQLLKAILAKDIEKMENLGIYEVIPEDFALIDYVSSSKIEAQDIVREGLNLMIKEVG